jgi:spore germination protein YaaH
MHLRVTIAVILSAIVLLKASGQEYDTSFVGIHQAESEYYSGVFDTIPPPGDVSYETPVTLKSRAAGDPSFMVYGWHPYWANASAYLSYDYDVLTHIAYFSFEVDTATGAYSNLRGWDTTPLISYAHQRGVKVMLTVTNFGQARNTEILTDTVKQWTLINSLVYQLKSRNGDGVNFDFESVPSAMKSNMVSFCRRAVRGIKAELPQAEISLATPAVNCSDGWDLQALAQICDYVIMMGYNYYWSGSTTAGPVAPLAGENYNITRSIDEDYLDAGVLQGKLLLGVPWYGYDWPVTGSGRKAATTGSGTSRVYSSTLPLVASYGKTFDNATSVPWLSYQNTSGWRQMWFEDSLSLRLKTGFALTRHLAGIGIWALSYEAGRPELWNGIKDAVSGTTSSDDGNITEGLSRAEILGIAPNPVSERSLITCHIPGYCSYTLTLYDMEGRAVKSLAAGTADPGTFQVLLDADSFSPGLYICVLRTPAGSSTATLAIVKNK